MASSDLGLERKTEINPVPAGCEPEVPPDAGFQPNTVSPRLVELLKLTVAMQASDLHLTSHTSPRIRVNGSLRPLPVAPLAPAETKQAVYSALNDSQRTQLERRFELDFAFRVRGLARFRCNVFSQRGSVAAAYRVIPDRIPCFDELALPPVITQLVDRPHGLVLITGPTGSGKSTTLAAIVGRLNRERSQHIITIEDPIEYVHAHLRCIVNQREVHSDTTGFGAALRAALRQDPDIVLIGELRDLETIEAALQIAETGHLTFSTLHTGSAVQTITRIIDVFPAHQQNQVRTQLSLVLEGIVCQALLPRADGTGRVPALEILLATPAVRNLIREDKVHQIYSMMQAGQQRLGMQTMNQSLATLYLHRQIGLETALAASSMKDDLRAMIGRAEDLRAKIGRPP